MYMADELSIIKNTALTPYAQHFKTRSKQTVETITQIEVKCRQTKINMHLIILD